MIRRDVPLPSPWGGALGITSIIAQTNFFLDIYKLERENVHDSYGIFNSSLPPTIPRPPFSREAGFSVVKDAWERLCKPEQRSKEKAVGVFTLHVIDRMIWAKFRRGRVGNRLGRFWGQGSEYVTSTAKGRKRLGGGVTGAGGVGTWKFVWGFWIPRYVTCRPPRLRPREATLTRSNHK